MNFLYTTLAGSGKCSDGTAVDFRRNLLRPSTLVFPEIIKELVINYYAQEKVKSTAVNGTLTPVHQYPEVEEVCLITIFFNFVASRIYLRGAFHKVFFISETTC